MIDRLSIALLVIILTGCGGGGGGSLGSSISGSSAEAPTISIVHRTSRFPNLGILAQDDSDVSYALAVTDFNRTNGVVDSSGTNVYYDESSLSVGTDSGSSNSSQYHWMVSTSANNIDSLPIGEFTFLGTAVRNSRFTFPGQSGTQFFGESELVINPTAGTGTLTADLQGKDTLNVSITGVTGEGRLSGSGTLRYSTVNGVYHEDMAFSGNLAGQNATEYSGVGVSDSFFIGAIGKR